MAWVKILSQNQYCCLNWHFYWDLHSPNEDTALEAMIWCESNMYTSLHTALIWNLYTANSLHFDYPQKHIRNRSSYNEMKCESLRILDAPWAHCVWKLFNLNGGTNSTQQINNIHGDDGDDFGDGVGGNVIAITVELYFLTGNVNLHGIGQFDSYCQLFKTMQLCECVCVCWHCYRKVVIACKNEWTITLCRAQIDRCIH